MVEDVVGWMELNVDIAWGISERRGYDLHIRT
jgi:hypothetical protein